MFGLLYVHLRKMSFSLSHNLHSHQGNTPLSLILLSILSVSLLHSAVMSSPSYLAGKGEKLRIQKTQTYTTNIEHRKWSEEMSPLRRPLKKIRNILSISDIVDFRTLVWALWVIFRHYYKMKIWCSDQDRL